MLEDEISSRDELFSRSFGGVLAGFSAAEGVVSSGLITSGAGAVLGYSGLLGSSYGVSRGAEIAFGEYDDGVVGRGVESSFSAVERGGDVTGGYLSSQMGAASGVASDIAAAHIGAGLAVGAIKGVAVASGAAKSVMFSKPGGSAARASASAKPPAASASTADVIKYKFESRGIFTEKPIEWRTSTGTKQNYRVFQRKDIDWSHVRTGGPKEFLGKTNREAALLGKPPQLSDGNFATLHHIGQDSRGALVEASTKYHGVGKKGQDILHQQFGRSMPNPDYPINRPSFAKETREYWKMRGSK